MNITLITFGSHDNYIKAGNRLIEQGKLLNIFDNTILYTPEYLKNDVEFWSMHSNFINTHKMGYGYWLWKSYIIKKTMEKMQDSDILLYLDAGCEIDDNCKEKILNCIDIVKVDKIIGSKNGHIERKWNKMDLVKKLNMNDNIYMNTSQREAGCALYLVCDETRKLVDEWYTLCCDYHNIDDTPSLLDNVNDFREHRHDQSIFSLLTKKYNIFSNSIDIKKVIHIIRNRSEISKLKNTDI